METPTDTSYHGTSAILGNSRLSEFPVTQLVNGRAGLEDQVQGQFAILG